MPNDSKLSNNYNGPLDKSLLPAKDTRYVGIGLGFRGLLYFW
jgi:hypothetical protein